MKPMSKQAKWQLYRSLDGLCQQCGKRKDTIGLCPECLEAHRTAARNSYRRKHGIPISVRLIKAGRPKKEAV
jgi:hypothetical protein